MPCDSEILLIQRIQNKKTKDGVSLYIQMPELTITQMQLELKTSNIYLTDCC